MTTLIVLLSVAISVGFTFSIIMVAITQRMKSDYRDTIRNMEKDMHESNERHQDLIYRLFDTVDEAQVIIDNQEAELKQLRASNDIYQSVYISIKPLTEVDEAELRKLEL